MKRAAKFLFKIMKSNICKLRVPYRCTFICTYKCNLNCQMCNIWKRKDHNDLSLHEIDDIFSKAPFFSWINISGGEIFLRDDIVQMIEIIDKRSKDLYILDFPTNGFCSEKIEEDVTAILQKTKVPNVFITISLDGPEDLHDSIRGKSGSWQKALDTYARLKHINNKKLKVFFGTTLNKDNISKLEIMKNDVRGKLGIGIPDNVFHFNLPHISEHYYGNSDMDLSGLEDMIKILKEQRHKEKKNWLSPVQFLERQYAKVANKVLINKEQPFSCQAANASVFIDPQGAVYPCTNFPVVMGQLRQSKYDLVEILNSSQKKDIRCDIEKNKCPICWSPCEAYQSILGQIWKVF